MAKQTLTWKNIEVDAMPKDLLKLHMQYHEAHEAMVRWFEASAKRANALQAGETVKLSVRGGVIGFAIAKGGSTNTVTDAKSMFS